MRSNFDPSCSIPVNSSPLCGSWSRYDPTIQSAHISYTQRGTHASIVKRRLLTAICLLKLFSEEHGDFWYPVQSNLTECTQRCPNKGRQRERNGTKLKFVIIDPFVWWVFRIQFSLAFSFARENCCTYMPCRGCLEVSPL